MHIYIYIHTHIYIYTYIYTHNILHTAYVRYIHVISRGGTCENRDNMARSTKGFQFPMSVC